MTIQDKQITDKIQSALTQLNLIEQHNFSTTELRYILEDLLEECEFGFYPEPEDLGGEVATLDPETFLEIPYEG